MTMTKEEYWDHEGRELFEEWKREQAEGPRPRDALVDKIELLKGTIEDSLNRNMSLRRAEGIINELIEKEIELRIREGILKEVV